jgi:VanZ family protein
MCLITLLSLLTLPDIDGPELEIPYLDKIGHFGIYMLAALFGCLFLKERTRGKMTLIKAILIIGVLLTFYGIILEAIQYKYTQHRTGEIFDAIANTAGILVGIGVVKTLFSKASRLNWED